MKTVCIASFTAVALASVALIPSAQAGDREWAVAGKVLTGVVVAGVVARALDPAPCARTTAVVYQSPPVFVAAPAPVCPPPPVATVHVVYPAPVVYRGPVVYPAPVVYAAPVVHYSAPPVTYVHPSPVVVLPPPGYGHRHHRHGFRAAFCW